MRSPGRHGNFDDDYGRLPGIHPAGYDVHQEYKLGPLVWRPSQGQLGPRFDPAIGDEPIPYLFGAAFVAAPYVLGGALVIFAPHPGLKIIGASMLIPGPSDPLLFAAGYEFGEEVEDWF